MSTLIKPGTKKRKKAPVQRSFYGIMENYFFSMETGLETYSLLNSVVSNERKKGTSDILAWIEKETKGKTKSQLKNKLAMPDVFDKLTKWRKLSHTAEFVPSSFFIGLVTGYESLLGSIIRKLIIDSPEILDEQIEKRLLTKDQQYKFRISSFNSMGALKDYLIDQIIENILRSNRHGQMNSIYTMAGYNHPPTFQVGPEFIEISCRRDILVHNSGLVSDLYIQKCTNAEYKFTKKPKMGEKLRISDEYFNRAYEILLEVGLILTYQIWIKTRPEESRAAIGLLNDIFIIKLITNGKYEPAKNIIEFLFSERSRLPEDIIPTLLINKLQILKWLGDKKDFKEFLSKEKFFKTKLNTERKMAVMVLTDKFEEASKLMHKANLNAKDYKEWPIFKEFIKSPQFNEAYIKIFGTVFK